MESSPTVISIGSVCFGLVIGFVAYRTLVRTDTASVTDISAVVAAVGGGAVTVWFDRDQGDSFAWYSIGLLIGFVLYYVSFLILNDKKTAAESLGGEADRDAALRLSRARAAESRDAEQ